MRFATNAARLPFHAPACNLASFLRTGATPEAIGRWLPTPMRARPVKTGVLLGRHARHGVFRFAEAALPRTVLAGIPDLISRLRAPPGGAASA